STISRATTRNYYVSKPRSSRPKVVTLMDKRKIIREIITNPKATYKETKITTGYYFSNTTYRKILKKYNIKK
ncbi:hypothetical protein K490DRAFT_47597, partial [Saccharata proteae CBS 121410]